MRSSRILAVVLMATYCPAQSGGVRITWIGQSCFIVQNTDGAPVVVTDPPDSSTGYNLPGIAADVVIISHDHSDHAYLGGIAGQFSIIDGRTTTARTEVSAGGMRFVLVPGFHDNQNGAQRGRNTMIRWFQGGLALAHLGDLGQADLTQGQAAALTGVDVLFIPAGGTWTIDPEQAAAVIRRLRPRVAVLMHFRTALGGANEFAGHPAVTGPFPRIVYKPSAVSISPATLSFGTEVWVMEPAADAVAVNSGGFTSGAPVAPGSLVTLFGNFAGVPAMSASGTPLPLNLGGVDVLIGGDPVPLVYVSPRQINLQLPRLQRPGQWVAEVRLGGSALARAPLTVVSRAPGLFAVVNQSGKLNSPAEPAQRGEVLQIYGTGQGQVTVPVPDGAPAPADPLTWTPNLPTVEVGGWPTNVLFSGLAPGLPGVWQINARIPADIPDGHAVPVVATHGIQSNALMIAIGAPPPDPNNPPTPGQPTPGEPAAPQTETENAVFTAVNGQRRLQGLPVLTWSAEMANAARAHSQAMADRGFFSHEDPIRGSLQQRLQAAGVACSVCGENLSLQQGYGDPVQGAVKGWMNSPDHRANMLDVRYKRTGIGVVKASSGSIYITQIFGS